MTCKLPLLTVDAKRPGRPAYHIPKEILVERVALIFLGVRYRISLECLGGLLCAVFKSMEFLICRNFPTFQMRVF